MRIILFSPLLILLIIMLLWKLFIVFDNIEAQSGYTTDSAKTSIFADSVLANSKTNSLPSAPAAKNDLKVKDQPNNKNSVEQDQAASSKNNAKADLIQDSLKATFTSASAPIMNESELKLLKELSQRRKELSKTQEELDIKAQILKATEDKIEQKISELKSLQSQVDQAMQQYNQKELGKIMSLVKIYENMKPRDAAKIFDELDMQVLLEVVSNMKEIKVAPVIAQMNPARARALSIELVKQQTLTNN